MEHETYPTITADDVRALESAARVVREIAQRAGDPSDLSRLAEEITYTAWAYAADYDDCPVHGEQLVHDRADATPGPDPYTIVKLACGHRVICLGPGESNMIIDR
jgi:hypothetical protein